MFGSTTTTNTGFGGFGTPAAATTTTTTPSLFGSAPSTSTPSLFGNSSTSTSSLFGGAASTTSAPTSTAATSSLFGGAPTNTLSSFGTTPAATSSAPSLFGSTPTPSLFGTSTNTNTAATATTAAKPSFFGTSGNSTFGNTTTSGGNSLFGGNAGAGAAASTYAQASHSVFNAPTAQQQQEEGKGYLDLDTCFPDTKVPHFVVTPQGLTRTVVPANFFIGSSKSTRDKQVTNVESKNIDEFSLTSVGFSESNKTLPFYLTSSADNTNTNNNNNNNNNTNNNNTSTANNQSPIPIYSAKKRVLEGSHLDTGRNVMAKNEQGIFSHGKSEVVNNGFNQHLNSVGGGEPPFESLNETGIQTVGGQGVGGRGGLFTQTSNEMNNPFGLFNTSRSVDPTKTRVRVFGYDGKDVEKIIKYFTNLGELAEPCQSQGNWITFNYVSPQVAQKAIECNGMNIDQNHLVGVTWDERAKQVENLHYQPQQNDLYKRQSSFMNIFSVDHQQGEQKLVDKIREKLLGW
ncbi:hypothetical protein INT47_011025 [Mucor saturninus]|uniref:RRM Nup35-type domain-containing protein n=1 Tax=Mucor saturninus TaxID=64648 RepID=A0A8H7RE82_9FUNG|nr:hypothetical protein INT47_011025 [Mucor saturninus]